LKQYPFKIYIPFACNIDALNRCVESVLSQIDDFSCFNGRKIVIQNDSQQDISSLIVHPEAVEIMEAPYRIKLVHAQQGNWMIQDAIHTSQPFALTVHADAEILPGAMQDILERYEELKDTKWGIIFGGKDWQVFGCYNPQFFVQEDVWFDPFLFPFYYMDNHMHRIMGLRGWPVYSSHSPIATIKHKSSHYLKEDSIFRRKNDIAFPAHGSIYTQIWGGLPGQERVTDPWANGTLSRERSINGI
jgi:hypothetical protein